MERRVPDIDKANQLVGFAPKTGLDEALTLTRDWFIEQSRLERGSFSLASA